MPNANKKKHKKPKREKVSNVLDFARGFIGSVGDKGNAQNKAKRMSEDALKAGDIKTSNFWTNIAGHIGKLVLIAYFLTGCSNVPDGTKSTGTYELQRMENDEVVCFGYWQRGLWCKWKDKK